MALVPKGNISHHVNKFLEQKSDHDWLLIPLNCKSGKDQFQNTVVFSTFPADLSQAGFANYVESTFCDLQKTQREKLKGMYWTNSHTYQQEDIIFDYGVQNGKISATLLQVVSQKNAAKELQVLVGVISLIRTPETGWHFNNDYWKSDQDRVKSGLQYLFGNEAKKELACHNY
ncbi:unnamed protein product [Adineta ricciae]|uniref:Uncharacterized protein n=1 Tax=Adineta ricciae TaxID=249248 RepID=A0A813WHR7_ADIRI|nr:unnamed protein product [Adineta ricciae]